MRIFFVSIIAVYLTSCTGGSAVSKKLSECDSLVITFNLSNGDSVTGRVSTTEPVAIDKLAGFLQGKETNATNCAFNGNLAFFKSGQPLLVAVFGYANDKCRYFMYDLDGKTVNAAMNNEAVDFLRSLESGKTWY